MLHRVRDLPVEARGVVESLIGRRLREDEAFSIRPVRLQKEGGDIRLASDVADRLEQYFAKLDQQQRTAPEGEVEAALDEAMQNIRPGYSPQR